MPILSLGKLSNKRSDGFTLIELIVAITIVSMLIGVVITQSGGWFGRNMKNATNRISSTIRYLHDKAASENLYMRMVFDFEKNSYWVEATTEPFMLTSKKVEEEDKEYAEDEEEEMTLTNEEGEEETIQLVKKYRTPEFGAVDEFLLKPVSFPKGVYLKDIYTSHDKGPVGIGIAFIYFFPNGYIEPAIINLRDEEDEINYSIEINPIIGSTKIMQEYREMETEGD